MFNLRRQIYLLISRFGIKFLQKVFPEDFQGKPLKPTDRYIECPFVIRNLPKPPAKILDVGCSGSFFPLLLASFLLSNQILLLYFGIFDIYQRLLQ